jgi:glutathione S-transferase
MKLYITAGSPYARMARIVVIEKGLENRITVEMAATRLANSPYYRINPSGRVPYLVRDDGVGMEESGLICRYLDHLDGRPEFDWPLGEAGWPEFDWPLGEAGWEAGRLDALASSLLDGLSVWGREISRPESEQSPTVIRHEADRAARMADLWERQTDHPLMSGPLNLVQIRLGSGLGLEARNPEFRWRPNHPKLSAWFDRIAKRPSFAATTPPG